jgi:hypothetical protein
VTFAAAAILVLVLVGAALVCAALYALFAKPSTARSKKRKQEVVNGFRLAGGILLGFVLMGSLVAFTGIAFGTATSSRVSRPLAALIAVSALILIALMVQRWAKYFSGWIAWGVVNSLIMASTGHLLNNPAIPVSRWYALVMAAQCLIAVLASRRFTKAYKLHVADKFALMGWILAFTLAATAERFSIPSMTIGTLGLVFVWWFHRSKSQRRDHPSVQRQEPESNC